AVVWVLAARLALVAETDLIAVLRDRHVPQRPAGPGHNANRPGVGIETFGLLVEAPKLDLVILAFGDGDVLAVGVEGDAPGPVQVARSFSLGEAVLQVVKVDAVFVLHVETLIERPADTDGEALAGGVEGDGAAEFAAAQGELAALTRVT